MVFCVLDRLGSFFIVKPINVMAFQLKRPGSMPIHLVFHVSWLEFTTCLPFKEESMIHLPPIEVDGEHEYEVEDIL
jgi:hypothetical protein